MGIINNDSVELPYGISAGGTYVAVAANNITTRRQYDDNNAPTGNYNLEFLATTWMDQAARLADKRSVSTDFYNIVVSASDISTSPYTLAYNHLKTVFSNTTDA